MKIKKIDEYNKYNYPYTHYVIKLIVGNEEIVIPGWEDEYIQNYDPFDLNSVIEYYDEYKEEYKEEYKNIDKLKIIKITEEELDQSIIDSKKYNL